MMDRFRTYLSGRRAAAVLLAAVVGTAALAGLGVWLALSGLGAGDAGQPHLSQAGEDMQPIAGLDVSGDDYPVPGWPDEGEDPKCITENFGHVRSQLLFQYQQRPDDPVASVEAALLEAAVEFESVTVRPATFPPALALNVYDEAFWPSSKSPPPVIHHVTLHGYPGDVRQLRVPGASRIVLGFETCYQSQSPGLPDLYAAFGDDVAVDGRMEGPEFARLRGQQSGTAFAGGIVLVYHSSTFRDTGVEDGSAFVDLVKQDEELRGIIEAQVRQDLRLSGVPTAITRIEVAAQGDSFPTGVRRDTFDYGRGRAHYLNVRVSVEGGFPHELPAWSREAAAEFSTLNAAADPFRPDEGTPYELDLLLSYLDYIHLAPPAHAVSAEAVYLDEADEEFWLHTGRNRIADLQGGYGWMPAPEPGDDAAQEG